MPGKHENKSAENRNASDGQKIKAPVINLPKGGGAIRGIGEKFAANPITGTGSMTIPIATSPGRSGFGPQLSLSYDSGTGNGPFGFGWNLSLPSISRKTDKGLPLYQDAEESDVFILSGAEDLVPVLGQDKTRFKDDTSVPGYTIHRYRPRIEGLFARIERWTDHVTGMIHWRSISRDNITTIYGKTGNSRISDPDNPKRIFKWLICESYDDKGHAMIYEYAEENDENIDFTQPFEKNRTRSANRYLKRVKYGNQVSLLIQPDLSQAQWLFQVVFDYHEGHYEDIELDSNLPEDEQHRYVRSASETNSAWNARPDPFSFYRSGFEIRTHRRCARVLMFHNFDELGDEPCLVRSTEFNYNDFNYDQSFTIESELAHQGSTRFVSFIQSITQSGFVRDHTKPVTEHNNITYVTYLKKSMPPVEFEYSKASIQEDIQTPDSETLENLPMGLDGSHYQWVDLDGEGISGILTEQAGSLYYKRNLSLLNRISKQGKVHTQARFGVLETVKTKPSMSVKGSQVQFMDLAGDGQLDLVDFDGTAPGFYERTDDEDWIPFKAFKRMPNIPWDDPNLRFVDLNGDGHADVLITENEIFTWYPSLAEEGFDKACRNKQPLDEEQGPRLILADGTQSIYLADMCGDGLSDLVRISNGSVCYWPNLGYGRFGRKVIMDHSPLFDHPDHFNQKRIRLADIDGTGTNDIIYLGREAVNIYFNKAGNGWSDRHRLKQFPLIDNIASVMTTDLLGNGTACLVWSSPLPNQANQTMEYIDLIGGRKPHLLTRSINNMGAETHIHYAPSTKFYLEDKLSGKPWITKIPFPVHVVERVETYDRISGNRFGTRYAYHHGHFDGVEREFRGFGMVEQWDTEEYAALKEDGQFPTGTNIDESSHVPPILTRTWFHTGVFLNRDNISDFFAGLINDMDKGEYFREPGLDDEKARALLLEDTVLPSGLTSEEEREACRALKGSMLRQEVYALDGPDKEEYPYTVTEQNYAIQCLQKKENNSHGVFFTHPREAISYHYERNPSDPRISHALTLEVDEYGNVLKEAAVGYGRRRKIHMVDEAGEIQEIDNPGLKQLDLPDQKKQTDILITYSENSVTNNNIDTLNAYRTPLSCESRAYELTGYTPTGSAERFAISDFVQPDPNNPDGLKKIHIFDSEINYEDEPTNGKQRRLIEHNRTLFRANDLTGPLPLGQMESLGLTFETYQMAFTPGLISKVYDGKVDDTMMSDEGCYVHSEGDDNWWIPSGKVFYSPNPDDSPQQELDLAIQHFFLPRRYRNPFHTDQISTESFVVYDAYDLMVQETIDALDNRMTAGERNIDPNQPLIRSGIDYRILQPTLQMDPNRNRTEIEVDALGMVVGTAVMGKPEEIPRKGDLLDNFEPNLTDAEIRAYIQDPKAQPHNFLKQATTRMVYDLFAFYRTKDQMSLQPPLVCSLARETHDADLSVGEQTKIQHAFSYSDGFGREIQKKIQAEPGPVPKRGVDGNIIIGTDGLPEMTDNDVSPRWVGSGWTIFNNKGKPVRQYEPYFTDTHHYVFDVRIGVSPVIFYDPLGRVVGTVHPNHTWEKVLFDPWRQEIWDVNDTILSADPKADPDVGKFFNELHDEEYLPTWYHQREGGVLGQHEQAAAKKAQIHANTPGVVHLDTLGRSFLTVAHNKFKHSNTPLNEAPIEENYSTRVKHDIQGNQIEVIDALGRAVMKYQNDMLGSQMQEASMDSGERWMLSDISGQPIRTWDSRGHQFRTEYDSLRRPSRQYVKGFDSLYSDSRTLNKEILFSKTDYGEGQPKDIEFNLRARVFRQFDGSGVLISLAHNNTNNIDEAYDFKGNLLQSTRQLCQDIKNIPDWSGDVAFETDVYKTSTIYDALNRPKLMTGPDNSILRPSYNAANLLERIDTNIRGDKENSAVKWTSFVISVDYDAKGQRTQIIFGNGVQTNYKYDPETMRLAHLVSKRNPSKFQNDCPDPPLTDWPGCQLQNLRYTYDPAGNIIHIRDDAQQSIFFDNKRVNPSADYTYDAIYQLIEATGREHLGQSGKPLSPDEFNSFHNNLIHPNNGQAMGTYIERYFYDAVGNILINRHRGTNPTQPGWKRCYQYAINNNKLLSTNPSPDLNLNNQCLAHYSASAVYTDNYEYDTHGNMIKMPHLPCMQWDFEDRLHTSSRQVVSDGTPETVYYIYDTTGQRVRKIIESQSSSNQTPLRMRERIYLGVFEIFKEYQNDGKKIKLERETLHIMDDNQRIAMVETRTKGVDSSNEQLIRYQVGNHLGSASIELNETAKIITYEEYYPYGSTSYMATRTGFEVPKKRYRFTGKEKDEESGLYYHGARYYAHWIGRWISADPIGIVGGLNVYEYTSGNPIVHIDSSGKNPERLRYLNQQKAQLNKKLQASKKIQNIWESAIKWREAHPHANRKETNSVLKQAGINLREQKSIQSKLNSEIEAIEREIISLKPKPKPTPKAGPDSSGLFFRDLVAVETSSPVDPLSRQRAIEIHERWGLEPIFVEKTMSEELDEMQFCLEAGGMTPAVGAAPDAMNVVISVGRGILEDRKHFEAAGWNMAATIPVVGQGATAARWAKRGKKFISELYKPKLTREAAEIALEGTDMTVRAGVLTKKELEALDEFLNEYERLRVLPKREAASKAGTAAHNALGAAPHGIDVIHWGRRTEYKFWIGGVTDSKIQKLVMQIVNENASHVIIFDGKTATKWILSKPKP